MFEFLTRELISKFLKFGIVGLSGVCVDFGVTYISKEKLKIKKYLANAIGFTVAATTNYFFNRWWTFQSHDPQIQVEYIKFLGVSIIGLGINTLILWLLVSKFKRDFYFSKLFAIGAVTIWNFIANYLYTFA